MPHDSTGWNSSCTMFGGRIQRRFEYMWMNIHDVSQEHLCSVSLGHLSLPTWQGNLCMHIVCISTIPIADVLYLLDLFEFVFIVLRPRIVASISCIGGEREEQRRVVVWLRSTRLDGSILGGAPLADLQLCSHVR